MTVTGTKQLLMDEEVEAGGVSVGQIGPLQRHCHFALHRQSESSMKRNLRCGLPLMSVALVWDTYEII